MTKSTKSEQVNKIGQAKHSASETLPVGYEAVRRMNKTATLPCHVESSSNGYRQRVKEETPPVPKDHTLYTNPHSMVTTI